MLAMLIYTVFWVLLMAVIYRMPSSGMVLKQTEAISDLLFDEEFPGTQYKKNFHEIMTEEELWQVNTAVHWPFTGLCMQAQQAGAPAGMHRDLHRVWLAQPKR